MAPDYLPGARSRAIVAAIPHLDPPKRGRRGVATLDYVLVMAVVLPLTAFLMWAGPRMMNLVYEMTAVLISWPFL